MKNYKVRILDERSISTGKKLKLGLYNKEKEEVVKRQWASFSTWQLEDGLENRLEQWGRRRAEEIEKTSEPDFPSEVEL